MDNDNLKRFCPLCDGLLITDGDYYQCSGNHNHRIHRIKEWQPYICGDKDRAWLRWRCKVRMGKMIQGQNKNTNNKTGNFADRN